MWFYMLQGSCNSEQKPFCKGGRSSTCPTPKLPSLSWGSRKPESKPPSFLLFHSDTTEQNRISFEAVTGQALQHSYKGEFRCQRVEFPNAFSFLHLFFFISINLCQFLKNLFWGEGKGTEQVVSYSELKEEIHAARGKTVEKCVSVADESSPLLMPLLKHQGVRVSQRGCTSQR